MSNKHAKNSSYWKNKASANDLVEGMAL